MDTPEGPVPRVQTRLTMRDKAVTAAVRCGIGRHQYAVAPGLYAVGHPDAGSDVLVTANFKLTFDHLRRELEGLNLWILVLDTKGVNVWCAAGKGTFATGELVHRVGDTGLDKIVDHKRLIVPQLGATGVSAKAVKAATGFRVIYGPIRASDIPKFLKNNRRTDPEMRQVTFGFMERLILTPVEVQIVLKPALITVLVLFLLSGIGPGIFSLGSAWARGLTAIGALVMGIVSGAVVTPMLLPYIPVREFALKGIITGCVSALALLVLHPAWTTGAASGLALVLFTITISSFLAMNFTGTTPFTSPSGVEKEMKRYIPVQLAGIVIAAGCWLYGAF
ncbi:MAG TPA: hypothetical protein DHV36_02915 [Desulfobacteraceae bacterium]|nr:hypothetical protein [Desulfobacteraceae bacterium]